MKRKNSSAPEQPNQDLINHLSAYKETLSPSPFFLGQTKAEVFQKIASVKQNPVRDRRSYLRRILGVVTSAAVLASVLFSGPLFAPRLSLASVGSFGEISGEVHVHRANTVIKAQSNDLLYEGDYIEVSGDSSAQISLAGLSHAELKQNTKIRVGSVMTMHLDDSVVTSQVHLSLTQGTFVQKKTEDVSSSPTLITLATPTGTIKASPSADFTVTAQTDDSVALDVHASGVTVLANAETSLDAAGATVVREGERVVMSSSKDSGDIVIVSAPVEQAEPALVALETTGNANANSSQVTRQASSIGGQSKTLNANDNAATIAFVDLPPTPVPDGRLADLLAKLRPGLDIAEVKMDQVVALYSKGQKEQALAAISGYVSTVRGVAQTLGANTPVERVMAKPGSVSMDIAVRQSPLATAYRELAGLSDVDKSSEEYHRVMATIELLSKAEAALRMDTQEDAPIAMSSPVSSAPALAKEPAASEPLTTRTYIKKVQTGIIGEVEALLQDPDTKNSTARFIALLARIPDEPRNTALLERIQSMVPGALKGFVAVKLHRISFPEAGK
ncbi:hypothetical protein COW46_05080 [Candidatus Gracilibacteria bacterium CG17_big_fil_post_rev_8_21_14_2_50_48_13]|nr:MAG: hypothetical protein COW46_05080 [Candidatus Gracilibacteria bacterium CG17_big_fil_post_rev_8_21_14_2_50_48_13]